MGVVSMETETWALCTGCDRWFPCPSELASAAVPGCPVCAGAPAVVAVVEERGSAPHAEAEVVFSELWLG